MSNSVDKTGLLDIHQISDFYNLYFANEGNPIDHMKLHKILYYSQAWHLVYFDTSLFNEAPQAWMRGPVYRSVYDRFKGEEGRNVFNPLPLPENLRESYLTMVEKIRQSLTADQFDFIQAIIKRYGFMSSEKLSMLTHNELPWNEARAGLDIFAYCDKVISFDSMKKYYANKLADKVV